MDEKYKRLFSLYKQSRKTFQEAVVKIGATRFDFSVLYDCLSQEDTYVLDGTRRILLTHFNEMLSTSTLHNFRDVSGDSFVQDRAKGLIEKRHIEKHGLNNVADEVVAMFS